MDTTVHHPHYIAGPSWGPGQDTLDPARYIFTPFTGAEPDPRQWYLALPETDQLSYLFDEVWVARQIWERAREGK